jgi:hypothetical protein
MRMWATIDEALLAIAWYWNLFGLPSLLIALMIWRARKPRGPVARELGWLFIGMACWSLVWLGQGLWASRGMGFVAAHLALDLLLPLISVVVNLPIGLGLLRRNRWARWAAIPWIALRAGFGIWAASWVRYGATLDWTEWPRLVVEHVLPAWVLIVLLLPSTARALRREAEPSPSVLLPRWLLVILGSVVVLDALDLSVRVLTDWLYTPGFAS